MLKARSGDISAKTRKKIIECHISIYKGFPSDFFIRKYGPKSIRIEWQIDAKKYKINLKSHILII